MTNKELKNQLEWAYKNLELMTISNMIKEIQRLSNKNYLDLNIPENQNILKSSVYDDLITLETEIRYLKECLNKGFEKLIEIENIK
tara:strand:+ start:499 stop:756 length:258 start_codon:yes stop_codon:yes gene_type:complete